MGIRELSRVKRWCYGESESHAVKLRFRTRLAAPA